MANHETTWKKWLEMISPIGKPKTAISPENFNGVGLEVCLTCGEFAHYCACAPALDMDAMAEALGLAAPRGPTGFVCEDKDCDGKNCTMKRTSRQDTRIANLEAVIRMLLNSRDPSEHSDSTQQAACRTARYFLEHYE